MQPTRVFIGIGSNIEPSHHITRALELLSNRVTLTGLSTLYQTTPIGRPGQPDYYNGVCMATTGLPPVDLHLSVLRSIEQELGRKRTHDRYAARPIDLDLLLYGSQIVNQDGLILPSPDIAGRAFVCLPLLELDSSLTMPDSGIRLVDLANQLTTSGMNPLHTYTKQLKEHVGL